MSEFVLAKPGKKYTGVQPRGMKTLIFEDGKRLSCHWQDFNELFIPLSVREQQIREELRQIKQELFNELDFSVSWTGEQVDEEPLTEDKIAINDAFDKVFAVVAAILGIEGEQTKMNRTEYKVGDVVKLKDRDGDLVKGFIYWDDFVYFIKNGLGGVSKDKDTDTE